MRRIWMSAVVALGVTLAVAPAMAVTNPGRVHRQARRINRGIASGQLTPRESQQLGREQGRIAQERADARADGHVTRGERHEIRHDLRRSSHHASAGNSMKEPGSTITTR